MNNLDTQYQNLLDDILNNGYQKKDRTGTGTLALFGREIRHKMSEGFPLLTTKKMYMKGIIVELLWFLRGDTNIKYLVDNNCNIWNGDAYKKYKSVAEQFGKGVLTEQEFIENVKTDQAFANSWGELGPIYGKQWRKMESFKLKQWNYGQPVGEIEYIDQIQNLIDGLKNNPDGRRHIVNSWNVGQLDDMTLPPCHLMYQCFTRELELHERYDIHEGKMKSKGYQIGYPTDYDHKDYDKFNIPQRELSLKWTQRSVDTFLGLPFNIASYGLLLMMLCDELNMVPGELIGSLGDTHLYLNHVDQAEEQIARSPLMLPTLSVRDGIYCSSPNDVILMGYESHPSIKAPLSN